MATPIPGNEAAFTVFGAAAAVSGRVVRVRSGEPARGLTTDSRAVRSGGGFLALRGERLDGHDYLEAAVSAGARVLLVEAGRAPQLPVDAPVDVIEVDDTLVAWGDLARAHLRAWRRGQEGARVVAITGSAGKTTTKELCAALLGAAAETLATQGNLNNRVGLPAMALAARPEHRFAVLETGMSVPGEIARLAAIAEPDVAVLLNVGVAHAEGVALGGEDPRAAVGREKGALLEALAPEGIAVVNADDPAAAGQIARTRARRVETFGSGPGARYRLLARESLGAAGSRLRVARPGGPLDLVLPIGGEAAAIDLLAGLAAAEACLGAPLGAPAAARGLAALRPIEGRSRVVRAPGGALVVDDAYNANPQSMAAALKLVAELAAAEGRRAVCVLGEMKELGPAADAAHDALGDALADAGVALVIGCGGAIGRTLARASARGVAVLPEATTDAAARAALDHVRPGDVVLVKGSRSVGAERVVHGLLADAKRATEGP